MRIAMVAESTEEHADHVADLSAALTAQGHDVTVYCRTTPDEAMAARGYRVVRVPAGKAGDPKALSGALATRWARDRPEVVHTHSSATAPAALTAAAQHGLPVVHTFRPDGPLRGSLDQVLTRAARVTTTCTAHAEELVTNGLLRSHISLVPDGVDVDLFTPDGPSAPTGALHRLVALGDHHPHAGFSTAIAALPALPNTELVVLGTPTDDLRRYAETLGVADRLRFTGRLARTALPALLRSADLAVCTPWHEPCHGPVLEAMACGITVVATTVGPLTDIVVDKVTGLLVPPRKPRTLADAVHRLLNHPVTREQYGATGRDRASARYAWQRIATETTHAYELAGVAPASTPPAPRTREGQPIGAWH